MTYFVVKTLITALIVAGISELARRYSLLAAALASLPITSILAFVWLYHDTRNVAEISTLSYNILWLIAPSLLFFVALPFLLETGSSILSRPDYLLRAYVGRLRVDARLSAAFYFVKELSSNCHRDVMKMSLTFDTIRSSNQVIHEFTTRLSNQ